MHSSKECLDKILISACFLGERVRYNGEIKALVNEQINSWKEQGRLIAICPEVIAGLPVPRSPAEINPTSKQIITSEGQNVTAQFNHGAEQALLLCQRHKIRFALLKESSPSCGSNTIYDGSFSHKKIAGEGVTTTLLRRHGIQVFCEDSVEELTRLIE
jgi:uncharacterized protein YbbK (DUF523 family)